MKKILTLSFLMLSLCAFSQQKISSKEIEAHKGDSVTVCEKVFGSRYLERTSLTVLYLGNEFPNHLLMVVIRGDDREKFKWKPESYFKGKRICVSGTVSEYGGKPRIVVTDPVQITID